MIAQIKDGGPVDVLAALDAASATFDNIRFERRHESTELQIEFWSRRIAEVIAARAAVAELIAAAQEMNRLAKGPAGGVCVADKRSIIARMDAALARCGVAK